MGGWEKLKKKTKPGGWQGENKYQIEIKEKKLGRGRGKNKVAKKIEIRAKKGLRKGKEKKVNLGWHKARKENHITTPSIHIGALVGVGSLWPKL